MYIKIPTPAIVSRIIHNDCFVLFFWQALLGARVQKAVGDGVVAQGILENQGKGVPQVRGARKDHAAGREKLLPETRRN